MIPFAIRYTLARCLKQEPRLKLALPAPWSQLARDWIKPRPTDDYLTLAALVDWILDGMPSLGSTGRETPLLKFDRATHPSPGLRLFEAFLQFRRFENEKLPKHKPQELFGLLAFALENQSEYSIGAHEFQPLASVEGILGHLPVGDALRYRHHTLLAVETVAYGHIFQNQNRFLHNQRSDQGRKGAVKKHFVTDRVKQDVLRYRTHGREDMPMKRLVHAYVKDGHSIKPFPDEVSLVRALYRELKKQRTLVGP